tara:strand:- start:990 stop:1631 length:642 start_codon:yes stop_codon:yes gene_type:complete
MGVIPYPSFFLLENTMKKILLTFLFLLIAFPVYAFELLMFSNPHCSYCQAFLNEVAPGYDKTEYAKYLPLKIIQVNTKMPDWIAEAMSNGRLGGIRATPTFVIWDNSGTYDRGKEIARLEGYPGKEIFYESIGIFIENTEKIVIEKPKSSSDRGTPPKKLEKFPNGVYNSQDIMDHIYDTETEAQTAANWLGCEGTHTHMIKGEKIFMPCKME